MRLPTAEDSEAPPSRRILPSAVRLSPTVTLDYICSRCARATDMQLWFNLIFASDTDRVLDGRRLGLTRNDAVGTKSKLAFGFDRGQDGARDDLMPNVVAGERSYGDVVAR